MKETARLDVEITRWKLEKFEGDHVEGDGKEPYEIIEGGKDLPTKRFVKKDGVYIATD